MGILKKILGKEETEPKKESKKANDDANREKMRTPSPVKTSIFDKVKSQKEQSVKKTPKVKLGFQRCMIFRHHTALFVYY